MGSVLATIGGVASRILGTSHPDAALLLAWGGLLTAFGGMIASVGSQVVAFTKIWSEGQLASTKASMERHDLANKLQIANLRILEQENSIAEYRSRIDARSKSMDRQIEEIRVILDALVKWKESPPIGSTKISEIVKIIDQMVVDEKQKNMGEGDKPV